MSVKYNPSFHLYKKMVLISLDSVKKNFLSLEMGCCRAWLGFIGYLQIIDIK